MTQILNISVSIFQLQFLTWLCDYGLQLESLWRETVPGAERGRQPVQQLAHMLSVELYHRVQALHLTQEMDSLQSLEERRKTCCQDTCNVFNN